MKSVKRFARMMALAVAVCMLLTLSVFATETGSFWAAESSAEGEAAVMGTGVVTDGVVEMTYDADALSPEDLQVNDAYVAMYSVNAEEPGVIRIAWVAPGEIEIDGEDWLFQLTTTGETEEDPTEDPTEAPTEGEEPTEAPTEPEQGEEPTEAPAEDGEDATEAPTKPSGNKKPGSNRPGTGDNTNITLLVALSLVCVAGIAAVATVMLKGKKEGKA